jgi:uncharacterized phage-associated protein
MPTCLQVADFFLWRAGAEGNQDAPELLTNLKLQKLLYYAQGFHLAVHGRRLFVEDVEAWQHGPVVPEVWRQFRHLQAQPIPTPEDYDRDAFTSEQTELLSEVYSVYGQFSAWKLRDMTHSEPPWKTTPQGGAIPDEVMAEYFRTLVVA